MDVKMISIGFIVISIVVAIGSFVFLKWKKWLVEKPFIYGILGSLAAQFMSIFVLADSAIFSMIINALFLSLVLYNIVMVFGIRLSKMNESEENFISYYAGAGVVGNFLNLFFFGLSGIMIDMYSKNPEFIETLGEDVISSLLDSVTYALSENLAVLFVSLISALFISYFSMRIFVVSFNKKLVKTNFKAILILFAYYIVGVFMPNTAAQINVQMLLYVVVTIAAYFIYKQAKNDEPSINITIIK